MHADQFCAYCGDLLADHGIESLADAYIGDEGSIYCCEDCLAEGEAELWEIRAYSPCVPDYND